LHISRIGQLDSLTHGTPYHFFIPVCQIKPLDGELIRAIMWFSQPHWSISSQVNCNVFKIQLNEMIEK